MVQTAKRHKRHVFQLNSATVVRLMDANDYFKLSVADTKVLRRCISVLTEKQLDMLTTVASMDDGSGTTRADIADYYEDGYVVGGAPEGFFDPAVHKNVLRLSDYRIGLLRVLVDAGLVVEHPRGKTFAYFVPAGVKVFLNDAERRKREQRAAVQEAALAAKEAEALAGKRAALWARLVELATEQNVAIRQGDGKVYRIDGKRYENTRGGLVEVEEKR
jgi:hypothetical protein